MPRVTPGEWRMKWMPSLRGPKAPAQEFTPPDLGLSSAKAQELEVWVRQILNRWKPQTEDPNNLARDLYELVGWAMSEADDPSCPILEVD